MSKSTIHISYDSFATLSYIHFFSTLSPVIFYAIHCKKEFSLKKFIALLVLAQLIGLYFNIRVLAGYHQTGKKTNEALQEKKIEANNKQHKRYHSFFIIFLTSSVIIAQLGVVMLDTFANILYFAYNKIKTWHYTMITLLCALISFIPIMVSEYICDNKDNERIKLINAQGKKLDKSMTDDVITKPSLTFVKATTIYVLLIVCPAVISCLHATYTLKVSTIITCITISQLLGTTLIIADLYTNKKAGDKLNDYLKKIDTKKTHEKEHDSNINNKCFAGVVLAVILGQLIASSVDMVVSRLYFSYEMVGIKTYIVTICICALASISISYAYEYVCGVKEGIALIVSDAQAEQIESDTKKAY